VAGPRTLLRAAGRPVRSVPGTVWSVPGTVWSVPGTVWSVPGTACVPARLTAPVPAAAAPHERQLALTSGLLSGSVALVVGGATGIGRGVVERFLDEGASVAVLDLDVTPLRGMEHEWPEDLAAVAGDAANPRAHEIAVGETVGRFGGIDVLVCCAGRFDFHTPIGSLSPDELSSGFDEIFAVNVKSPLLAVRAALAELRRREGSVVLTLSSSAFHPEGAGVLYGSSKWATRGLVSHLARELAPSVRVNGVAPGGTVGTRLSGLEALGERRTVEEVPGRAARLAGGNLLGVAATPGDHAGAYVFLASRRLSPFVNGAVVNSDGGRGEPIGTPGESPDPVDAALVPGHRDAGRRDGGRRREVRSS